MSPPPSHTETAELYRLNLLTLPLAPLSSSPLPNVDPVEPPPVIVHDPPSVFPAQGDLQRRWLQESEVGRVGYVMVMET